MYSDFARNIKASVKESERRAVLLGTSDQLSNPAVASGTICGDVGAWLTILRRALRKTLNDREHLTRGRHRQPVLHPTQNNVPIREGT